MACIQSCLLHVLVFTTGADPEIFQRGGGVQEDCLLFFALFYYSPLFLTFKRWRGVATPVTPPPLDPPMHHIFITRSIYILYAIPIEIEVPVHDPITIKVLKYLGHIFSDI